MKNIKKSFLMSSISLLLCFIMLLGTTFAWFTDSVTSSGNKIQAGTLKLDLEMLNKETGAYESIKTSNDPIFNYNLWEPGYTDVKFLKVENEGSLSLKWKAMFVSDEEVSKLAEVIDVYVLPSVTELGYDNLTRDFDGWRRVGTLDQFINTLSETTYGNLLPYSCAYLGIALHMQESAGNEYQEIGLEAFDIQIVATQMSNEEDSFGPDYDNDAEWPASGMNFSATQSLAGVNIIYGELAEDVIIRHESGAYAIVPAGTKLADGVTELKFSGKGVDNAGNFDDETKSYDIHIEGIADDNTKCIKVFIGAILDKNLGETELKLYHEDVQMTRVNSVEDFAINNQFTYDPETGAVVLYVDNFSIFSGVKTNADKWDGTSDTSWYDASKTEFTLTTAEQLAGFRDLVDGKVEGIAPVTFAGKTVKLGADIDLNKIPFDPIGYNYESKGGQVFKGTFDGANHTIYNLYQNCWELDPDKTNYSTYTYSTAGAGLFASIKDATIKNLAVSGAEIVFECVDMGIIVGYAQGTCHFENIVISHSKIANYNRYTGGVVGEVSDGPYGTDTTKGYSHTFKNIVVDSTVTVSGLWGSFGCGMGGVIGGKWGDATVWIENVISAPVMDVYNDVVSAYQWYAFRGCGMLIGHTEEPYSDGRHSGNATASFLTCENVSVYYGAWVNYTYYQFANQTDAEGNPLWYSNYPWVRAEKGEYCEAFSNIRYGIPLINGVKVTELDKEAFNAAVTSTTTIVFNQLYGADLGMYGTNDHPGVKIINKATKTIYIQNDCEWTNLKLQYWFKNGEDYWTTTSEGLDMSTMILDNGVYKINLPAHTYGFKIIDDDNSKEFLTSSVSHNGFYTLSGNHQHVFDANNNCVCGAKRVTLNIADYAYANGWKNEAQYHSIKMEDIELTANGKEHTGKYYTNGENWRFYQSENSILSIVSTNGNIVSVKATYLNEKNGTLILNGENISSGSVVSINDTFIQFGVGTTENVTNAQVRITSIEIIYQTVPTCDHSWTIVETKEPTCTNEGYTATICGNCAKVIEKRDVVGALGHSYTHEVTKQPTCTETGIRTYTCETCQGTYADTLSTIAHTYEQGKCNVCGKIEFAGAESKVYIFSEYKAGTQYASNEEHILDSDTVIVTTKCHFTSELRIYSSSTYNGYAIVKSTNPITQVGINAGYKADELVIYGSNDNGATWTEAARISITSTSYNDYAVELDGSYNWIKLDVENDEQVRVKTLTLTTVSDDESSETPECTHENTTTNTVDATCVKAGSVTVTCDDCGETISTETIEATGVHTYQDGVCTGCGKEEVSAVSNATLSFANKNNRTSFSSTSQVWEQNGVKFTNNKASSSNAVADYASPVRLYQGSSVTVEATGIKTIVFDCNSSSYATALKNSIGTVSGATVTVSSDKVTVTLDSAVDSFTIAKLTAQVRLDSITVNP